MENNLTIKVSRCEPYPIIEPQGYVVGFTLYINDNGHSIYKDVFVTFAELARAEISQSSTSSSSFSSERNLVLDLAYKKIATGVQQWVATTTKTPASIGEVYIPPPLPVEDVKTVVDEMD